MGYTFVKPANDWQIPKCKACSFPMNNFGNTNICNECDSGITFRKHFLEKKAAKDPKWFLQLHLVDDYYQYNKKLGSWENIDRQYQLLIKLI